MSMNRIIKFRAFYQKSQTFVYFNLSEGFTDEGYKIYRDLIIEGTPFQQFTGLFDKNGKEIYEGDLIAEIDKIEELEKWGVPLTVCFGEFIGSPDSWGLPDVTTGFYLLYNKGSSEGEQTGLHNRDTGYGFESKEIIVVGNIFENSVLISW